VTLLEPACARIEFPNPAVRPGRALGFNKPALNLATESHDYALVYRQWSSCVVYLKFALHKGGAIHFMLFLAISFTSLSSHRNRRTKQYKNHWISDANSTVWSSAFRRQFVKKPPKGGTPNTQLCLFWLTFGNNDCKSRINQRGLVAAATASIA